jgi:TRAP transporter 4TM/12TM fusion protein
VERALTREALDEPVPGSGRTRPAWAERTASTLSLSLCAWGLYGVVALVTAQKLRVAHVGLLVPLAYLLYPWRPRAKHLSAADVGLAVLSAVALAYVLWDFDAFVYRSSRPSAADLAFGAFALATVLEAGRRAAGWMLPALTLLALGYARWGAWLPSPFTHRGYALPRVIGLEYMGLEGLFGTPVAVSATFIVLFTLYGAVVDASGAGRFFLDFSFAAVGRHRAGAGRTVTLASFLLGGPSGSGVATAVTLASVATPMLRRAGYDRERAGAILSAGGIGAVLSPPVMGAASFLIAELTRVPYVEVIRWSLVPTLLYYVSILLMIELDAARLPPVDAAIETVPIRTLLRRGWVHLLNLLVLVGLLVSGMSAARAVVWSIALAVATSWLRRADALTPSRLLRAFDEAGRRLVPVGVTCAVAGILVGVVSLTGLGLKFSGILIGLSGGHLLPALLATAGALLVLGLALPVTASYVVAAVITAPALVKLGVPEPAAHLFIFYFALLSEVTPPTALSCLAVSAVTGGDPYRTMWHTWRYALPAFVVPFLFALPGGMALLLVGPWPRVLLATVTAIAGIAALVAGAAGYWRGPLGWPARAALLGGGLLLLAADARADAAGAALAGAALAFARRPKIYGVGLP